MAVLNIFNENNFDFQFEQQFNKIVDLVIDKENQHKESEVSVIIVSLDEIHSLNKQYRNKDKPTDVLSFPADQEMNKLTGEHVLGDIYICADKVKEQAEEYEHSLEREWCYLFAHGMHHLLGYDHESEKEKDIMDGKVDIIMNEIKVGR